MGVNNVTQSQILYQMTKEGWKPGCLPSLLSFCGAHSLQPVTGAKISSIHRLTSSPTLPPYLIVPLPSPLFSLLSVNPPRPDYEVGGTSPSSFTPIINA